MDWATPAPPVTPPHSELAASHGAGAVERTTGRARRAVNKAEGVAVTTYEKTAGVSSLVGVDDGVGVVVASAGVECSAACDEA